jgi:nucleotide-binding universal stress UspA family protein
MKRAKRILVGLKTLDSAGALVELGCRLGARGARLLLVHVIELPDITPLNAEVPGVDAMAARIVRAGKGVAHRNRMRVESLVLRAHNAGEALLDELKTRKIELAVLGYHRRRTLGELILGTTARHLANKAPCHIVLNIPRRD